MMPNEGAFQRGAGYALTLAVAAFLIVAWILTAPFIRWGVSLGDYYRKRFHSED
jgi:hypothetical protein